MMGEEESLPRDGPFYEQPRFWQGLFMVAIILNVYVILNSDLGLDAHVEGAYVQTEDGWVLDWGDTRTEDPLASNPEDAKVVHEESVNSNSLKVFAALGMILTLLIALKLGLNRSTMTILMLNREFSKNMDKPTENKRFWLPQPAPKRLEMASSPVKMAQDRPKTAPRRSHDGLEGYFFALENRLRF